MPLFRRLDSSCYWYDFRYAGNRYRGSTSLTNKAAAAAFEADLLLRLRAGEAVTGRKAPLLKIFLAEFLSAFNLNLQRSASTKRYYANGARLLLATPLRDLPIDKLTRSVLSAARFPGSAANANNALRTLSRCLTFAVERGYLHTSLRVPLYRERQREDVFTPEQETRLLSSCGPMIRDFMVLLFDTGMRPAEACRLRWVDVMWEARTIQIAAGKTSASTRTIGASSRLLDMLRTRASNGSDWVFPSSRSREGHITNYSKAFRKALTDAALPTHLVPYNARHTFGTGMMEATKNLKLTMKTMGHIDVKTSMRYQHPDTQQVGSVIDARNTKRNVTIAEDGHVFGHARALLN